MEVVIKPRRTLAINFQELYSYRELFFYFGWRDIKVRYKQTAIGAGWAIFKPFIQMVVFTVFFNKAAGISSGGTLPYAIFSFSGLLFFNFFTDSLTRTSNSLVDNQAVITKIYFPRLIPPISAAILPFVDFLVASVVFAGLMVYYHIVPGLSGILLLPALILISFIAATGAGLFLAAVNVKYRDVKQALPFFISILLFVTPVIIPLSKIPQSIRWALYLNPMTGVIATVRAALLHQGAINWGLLWLSLGISLVTFVFGLAYFKSREKEFADII